MIHILYLEDDTVIRDVTYEYLKMKNYRIDCASDGKEAQKYLEENSYDLAILDIMVPLISGYDILDLITQKQPQCATIMLTALDDEKSQLEAFNRFADDYMIKPFSPLLLLKRIEAILRRSVGSEPIESGVVLRKESYQAYYLHKALPLTVTEYLLLETLFEQKDRVFTREQLLNIIAPDDFMVSDRVIDAHIKNLRKKLPYKAIKTVIGIGYQYSEDSE